MIKILSFFLLPIFLYGNTPEAQLLTDTQRDKHELESIAKDIQSKNIKSAIERLEKLILVSSATPIVLQSKLTYTTLVLDFALKDKAKTALNYIVPLAIDKQIAEYQYITAHLYYLDKDFDMADAFLQLACTNKTASKEILDKCYNTEYIEQEGVIPSNITIKPLGDSQCYKIN